jgi:chromosome segregation ATPase
LLFLSFLEHEAAVQELKEYIAELEGQNDELSSSLETKDADLNDLAAENFDLKNQLVELEEKAPGAVLVSSERVTHLEAAVKSQEEAANASTALVAQLRAELETTRGLGLEVQRLEQSNQMYLAQVELVREQANEQARRSLEAVAGQESERVRRLGDELELQTAAANEAGIVIDHLRAELDTARGGVVGSGQEALKRDRDLQVTPLMSQIAHGCGCMHVTGTCGVCRTCSTRCRTRCKSCGGSEGWLES